MKKIKWNKIWNSIPLACAGAGGGAVIGGAFGGIYIYIGTVLAFIYIMYNEYK